MSGEACPVCDGFPRVLVAVAHPAMRRMILELLDREHRCWNAFVVEHDLCSAMHDLQPDLVIVDGAAFPDRCCHQGDEYPCERIVVVGPEPDAAYKAIALQNGAGGWVARDDVADDLSAEMRKALGCIHTPCPTFVGVGAHIASVGEHALNPYSPRMPPNRAHPMMKTDESSHDDSPFVSSERKDAT